MSLDRNEEKYGWVRDALLEEFPEGTVVFGYGNYTKSFHVELYENLPDGKLWKGHIVCSIDGRDVLGSALSSTENIKEHFRKMYGRACYEQQTSGS